MLADYEYNKQLCSIVESKDEPPKDTKYTFIDKLGIHFTNSLGDIPKHFILVDAEYYISSHGLLKEFSNWRHETREIMFWKGFRFMADSNTLTQKPIKGMVKLRPTLLDNINRVEIIGPDGREYVKYDDFEVQLQDDNKTLKLFYKEKQ